MNQLKAGATLNYTVIVLNILVGLLYTPFLLRILGQSDYGIYSLVASVISYLTLLDLGFGNAIIRYTAKSPCPIFFTFQKLSYDAFGNNLLDKRNLSLSIGR